MGYVKAEEILPIEIIELIQHYVDGTNIYIPRKEENKIKWGQASGSRAGMYERNLEIYHEYLIGISVKELAIKYYLSEKSIWRILHNMKKEK